MVAVKNISLASLWNLSPVLPQWWRHRWR